MATRHYWSLVYDGSCSYQMPNPGNNSIPMAETSTSKMITLVDGSKAFITPQVKSIKDGFTWEITEASARDGSCSIMVLGGVRKYSDFSILKYFNDNHTRLAVTTHTNYVVNGYISKVERQFTLSGAVQKYIIKVDFMPED